MVRQMVVEPQRCAKCQLYGHDNNQGAPHFARDCRWTHDICGLCGNMHRASDCTAQMPEESYCVNCQTKGHTVHNRSCPTFVEMQKKTDRLYADQQFQFFVTSDAKTWETAELIQPPSPPAPPPSIPNTRQGTSGRWACPPHLRDQNIRDQATEVRCAAGFPPRHPGPKCAHATAANAISINGQSTLNHWFEPTSTLSQPPHDIPPHMNFDPLAELNQIVSNWSDKVEAIPLQPTLSPTPKQTYISPSHSHA